MWEKRLTLLFLATSFAAVPPVIGQHWPQWRGPDRDGQAAAFHTPAAWPENLKQVWRVPAGAGLSSPVAADGLVYLLTRDGDDEVVTCRRTSDGSTVWTDRYSAPFLPNSQAVRPRLFPNSGGKGPFATPLLHDGKLYTLGVGKILSCYQAKSGKKQWRQAYFQEKLPEKIIYVCPPCKRDCDNQQFTEGGSCPGCGMTLSAEGVETSTVNVGNYYGTAASPLVAGGVGVVLLKDGDGGRLIAFDPESGDERWTWTGPVPASSSPVAATLAGLPQLVVVTRESCVGLTLADGRQLWQLPIASNAQIVTPIVHEDLVIYAEYRLPMKAARILNENGTWRAEPAWENDDHPLLMSTPVLHEGKLYGFDTKKRGRFFVAEAATGATLWRDEGNRGQYAALLACGSSVLGLTDSADLVVFNTAGQTEQVAAYQVADTPVWTYPVLWENNILVKDAANLTLWRLE